jgi:hypothetical protein
MLLFRYGHRLFSLPFSLKCFYLVVDRLLGYSISMFWRFLYLLGCWNLIFLSCSESNCINLRSLVIIFHHSMLVFAIILFLDIYVYYYYYLYIVFFLISTLLNPQFFNSPFSLSPSFFERPISYLFLFQLRDALHMEQVSSNSYIFQPLYCRVSN